VAKNDKSASDCPSLPFQKAFASRAVRETNLQCLTQNVSLFHNHHVLEEPEEIEERKQALIDDLLRERAEAAIAAFDEKLAKLGY
jgi:hypothetical protein